MPTQRHRVGLHRADPQRIGASREAPRIGAVARAMPLTARTSACDPHAMPGIAHQHDDPHDAPPLRAWIPLAYAIPGIALHPFFRFRRRTRPYERQDTPRVALCLPFAPFRAEKHADFGRKTSVLARLEAPSANFVFIDLAFRQLQTSSKSQSGRFYARTGFPDQKNVHFPPDEHPFAHRAFLTSKEGGFGHPSAPSLSSMQRLLPASRVEEHSSRNGVRPACPASSLRAPDPTPPPGGFRSFPH